MPAFLDQLLYLNRQLKSGLAFLKDYRLGLSNYENTSFTDLSTLLYALQLIVEDIHFTRTRKYLLPLLTTNGEYQPIVDAHIDSQKIVQERMLKLRLHLHDVRKNPSQQQPLTRSIDDYVNCLSSHLTDHHNPIMVLLDESLSENEKTQLIHEISLADQNDFNKAHQMSSQILNNFLSVKGFPAA